jgi:hypothetical protein
MREKSVVVICFYFGNLPDWFDLYFESLKLNSSIDFLFYTDCNFDNYIAPNVKFESVSLNEYFDLIESRTGINISSRQPYKLCDFRPLLAQIHWNEIEYYDYYGYADIDLIFGDIRKFYNDFLRSNYDVISTHEHTLSDHFVIFKNNHRNRTMYKNIGGWYEKISAKETVGIGEDYLLKAYRKYIFEWKNRFRKINSFFYPFFGIKLCLIEQYTTPFIPIPWTDGSMNSNQPNTWYYINGEITNNRDKGKSFIYLHFMNFKSSKYRHDGTPAPWENKEKICFAKQEDMKTGIVINSDGIMPLKVSKF